MANNSGLDIAKEIAEKITSKNNQHCVMVIVGRKGVGKSWTALRIGWDVSCEVAKIKKKPVEKYFSLDNVAIITKEEVLRVLKTKMSRYATCILDDVGPSWGARDFATKFNKIMNNIFQTFRTKNVFLILTVPDQSYLDKLPREGVDFLVEVVDSYFDKGFVECKIKESKKPVHSSKVMYPFVSRNNIRYVRHLVHTAPEELTGPYEKLRTDIEKIASDKGIAELEAMTLESDNPELKKAQKKRDILRPAILALDEMDKYTQTEIGQLVGCSQQLVSQISPKVE